MVAVRYPLALVKVNGHATFKLAPPLKHFHASVAGKGCHEMVFDMGKCTGMDSTFMGVLAGIAMWPGKGRAGVTERMQVDIINLSLKTKTMLTTLGLDRILNCCARDCTPPDLAGRLAEIPAVADVEPLESETRRCTLDTMLQAHRHLVEADADNSIRFYDVLTYLEQELQRMDPGE